MAAERYVGLDIHKWQVTVAAVDVSDVAALRTRHGIRTVAAVPAGPFTDADRPAFLAQLKDALAAFTRSIALTGTTHP